ncbi:hypothetical protein INF28_12140, partial [Oscillospiraceae bacterium DSM 107454]|nr:hypothetical protein [Ructibacterium gallinarum]
MKRDKEEFKAKNDMHPKSWTYIVEIMEVYIMGKELYCKEIKLEAVQYVLSGHS